jgi:SAM-dependent methyltransferase
MTSLSRHVFAAVLLIALCDPALALAQAAPPAAPGAVEVYEKFRAWLTMQPPDVQQGEPLDAYRKVLAAEGLNASDVEGRIRLITQQGEQLEIERWNRILTAPSASFNTKPNEFLVEMTRGVRAGTALDVGMGQGRNALYLAQQGWAVTGFDPADKAVAAARAEAARLGVKLTALVQRDDEFDFGRERWDLVVLSYVSLRHLVSRVYDALEPGGMVIVEGFHRDATKTASIGGGVVFDTNELLKLFERFRVIRYEDVAGTGDFGLQRTRLVRLCAQKP